ncbi:porin [Burkholderia sp. WAC0059]|uniref:porin n=1 Tax=Burkholderia sp. WAC0059 TaxID=2066022 RepID=UPI000C7F1AC4|nr:porin [Burkholderia sp. WAC0059]PLZ02519.1 porin [Burkholderia sp. WAC0059]
MKKTFAIAVLATGCASGAYAQSSVSLYGIIDSGLIYTNNQGGAANWQLASGDVTGSHWGIAGHENLGGGNSAIFQLENGFSATNGTLRQGGREFGFQSYAGLSNTRYGAVTFGRQYDSVVDYVAPLSFTGIRPGGNNLSAHPFDNDNLNNSFRVNNAVKYTSASWNGIRFGGLYSFSDEAGGFADNRLYSFGASWDHGPLRVAAAYLQANNPGSASNAGGAITLTERTFIAALQRIYGAGANYDWGAARLGFVWTRTQLDGLATINGSNGLGLAENGSGADFDNYEINGSYRLTPALVLNGEYTFTQASLSNGSGTHHPSWNEVSLQTDYFLSKRTDVYLQASYQHIASDGSGLTADISGQGLSSSDQQVIVAAGMRHRF